MRKSVILILVLILLPVVHSLSFGTVRGYVLNTNGDPFVGAEVNITVVGCSLFDCAATDNTDSNGFYIKSNLNIVPGDTINVSAVSGSYSGVNSEIATGNGNIGIAEVNITICAPPTAPNLNTVSDTHDNSLITMSWTTFKTGLEYDEFIFDSDTPVSPATSPQTESNVAYTSHTWKVRTCSVDCCSDYDTDTFEVTNNAPSVPTLTDQAHTQSTSVDLEWINYSDSDGDSTFNQLQLSTFPDFSSLIYSTSSAVSPQNIGSLTTLTLYYWRVRTCDDIGECSGWNNDSFFVYPVCSVSGGTSTKTIYKNNTEICIPEWECGDWGICGSPGISTRGCKDINDCVGSVPKEYQTCFLPGTTPITQQLGVQREFFIGDFQYGDVYQAQVGQNEEWIFVYNEEEHSLRIIEKIESGVYVEISSEPKRYFVPNNGSITVDVDEDGESDILIRSVQISEDKAKLVFEVLKTPEERIPLGTTVFLNDIKNQISRGGLFVQFLLLLIVVLVTVVVYQQKYVAREVKVDKKLGEYVVSAMNKGFTENQIKSKLAENGFAEIEINYVLNKIRNKKS